MGSRYVPSWWRWQKECMRLDCMILLYFLSKKNEPKNYGWLLSYWATVRLFYLPVMFWNIFRWIILFIAQIENNIECTWIFIWHAHNSAAYSWCVRVRMCVLCAVHISYIAILFAILWHVCFSLNGIVCVPMYGMVDPYLFIFDMDIIWFSRKQRIIRTILHFMAATALNTYCRQVYYWSDAKKKRIHDATILCFGVDIVDGTTCKLNASKSAPDCTDDDERSMKKKIVI